MAMCYSSHMKCIQYHGLLRRRNYSRWYHLVLIEENCFWLSWPSIWQGSTGDMWAPDATITWYTARGSHHPLKNTAQGILLPEQKL